jgi:uncharacterized protein YndB with AHSA1/START domain
MNLAGITDRAPGPAWRAASVRLSRELDASSERIFDAWLDAAELSRFLFAGRVAPGVHSQLDPRVGGEFRISGRHSGERGEYAGEFLEIDRPQRLVFSLFVEKSAQQNDRVIVELAPVLGRSLLVLTHELSLPSPEARLRVRRGWARLLDRLAAALVRSRH